MLSEERISEIRNQVAYLARIRKDLPLSTHDHHYEQDCGELLTAYNALRGENEALQTELNQTKIYWGNLQVEIQSVAADLAVMKQRAEAAEADSAISQAALQRSREESEELYRYLGKSDDEIRGQLEELSSIQSLMELGVEVWVARDQEPGILTLNLFTMPPHWSAEFKVWKANNLCLYKQYLPQHWFKDLSPGEVRKALIVEVE